MHRPPTEGNFCDELGKVKRPVTVTDYNWYMGYVAKGTEWLKAIQLVKEQRSGQKNIFLSLEPK
jgi:hypothetical protein